MINYNGVISDEKLKRISYFHRLRDDVGKQWDHYKDSAGIYLEEKITFLEEVLGKKEFNLTVLPESDSWIYFGESKAYVKESDKPQLTGDGL